MNNTTERSTILLVILGIDAPAGASRAMNVALLQSIFEHFGSLQRIIIFTKDVIVKAFIEFSAPEDAAEAKAFVHNSVFNNSGIIRVFFSALQKLEFSSRFVECKDLNPTRAAAAAHSGKSNPHKAKVLASENMSNQKTVTAVFKRSKQRSAEKILTAKNDFNNLEVVEDETQSKNHTEADALSTQLTSVRNSNPERPLSHSNSMSQSREKVYSPLTTLDSLNNVPIAGEVARPSQFSLQQASMNFGPSGAIDGDADIEEPLDTTLPVDLPETDADVDSGVPAPLASQTATTTAKVVLLSNLDDFFFSAGDIFNLFSCFGNVVRVLLMKNLKKALVEYKRPESAEVAVNYMNNKAFGRSKLKVVFSKFKKIDLKRNNKSENSQNFNEVLIVSNKMNRFKNSSQNVIAPTDTLLVLVEKTSDLSLSDVMLAVQLFGKPAKTKTLEESVEVGEDGEVALYQLMFKFPNVVAAMKVLAQAHNSDVKGHFLSVTFAPTML